MIAVDRWSYVMGDLILFECPSGPVYDGHCRQVVLSRVTFSIYCVNILLDQTIYSGHCRQVVMHVHDVYTAKPL